MRTKTRTTQREILAMQRLYKNGMPVGQIAATFDLHETTVGYYVNGTTMNRKRGEYLRKRIQNMTGEQAYNFAVKYLVG